MDSAVIPESRVPYLYSYLAFSFLFFHFYTTALLQSDVCTPYQMDTFFFVMVSWLNIRTKCCKACGTGPQERYCLI